MDQSLEPGSSQAQSRGKLCFNPYFSGSVTGTLGSSASSFSSILVSILILVDQSLELFSIFLRSPLAICFNPYFSGSVTGTQLLKLG